VFVGVSPKFKLLLIVEFIAPGNSDNSVPLIVTPACSGSSTLEPLLLSLKRPFPKQI